MNKLYKAIGLMSGTSLDGVDVALIETDGAQDVRFLAKHYLPFAEVFKKRLQALARGDVPLNDVLRIERQLTQLHADAVNALLQEHEIDHQDIDVIGFHGQTIRHLPEEGLTWQLGDASYLAEKTHIPVVADFRRRDMAAGGQGAPLIPLYHQSLMVDLKKPCAVLNIGGVANITFFGADGVVIAGDTGPGMGLIDAWATRHGAPGYDKDGMLAASGQVDQSVVDQALHSAFFLKSLPKSADRYDFDAVSVDHLTAEDGAATLCALTAQSVINSFKFLPQYPEKLWLTGGGGQHPVVRDMLAQHVSVGMVEELGLRSDSMEAECFAWLAVRRLEQRAYTLKETTGAAHNTVGGVLTV